MTSRQIQIVLTPPGVTPPPNAPTATAAAERRLTDAIGPVSRCVHLLTAPEPIRVSEVRSLLHDHLQHHARETDDTPPQTT